ncbi:MAG: hypothetical protein AAFR21_11605 [Pseudomonadota bacterium]
MSIQTAKQYHHDMVHFLRKEISYTDDGSTVSLGWIPPGASVIDAGVNVFTVFDGGTTNDIDIGYRNGGNGETDDTDEFASSISLATAGIIAADELATAAVNHFPGGAEIVAPVVSTAGATAGAAIVWLTYIVDNED